jgi:hypothetical protein
LARPCPLLPSGEGEPSSSLLRFAARPLFGRHRTDDELAPPALAERRFRPDDRGGKKCLDLATRQHVHRLDGNEARLIARAEQELVRIGELRAVDEAQPNAVGSGGDRNNAVRWAFGGAVAQDEEVVAVVGQLVAGGKALVHGLPHRANQLLVFRLELDDEALDEPFRRGR